MRDQLTLVMRLLRPMKARAATRAAKLVPQLNAAMKRDRDTGVTPLHGAVVQSVLRAASPRKARTLKGAR